MFEKIIKSPYAPIIIIAIICIAIMAKYGFHWPDLYYDTTRAQVLTDFFAKGGENLKFEQEFSALYNKSFYVYSLSVHSLSFLLIFAGFLRIKNVKEYCDLRKIFIRPKAWFAFVFVNFYFLFFLSFLYFCCNSIGHIYLISQYDAYPIEAVTLFLIIVLVVYSPLCFVPINILLGLNYFVKKRYNSLILVNIFGILSMLLLVTVPSLIKLDIWIILNQIFCVVWIWLLISLSLRIWGLPRGSLVKDVWGVVKRLVLRR